MNKHFKTKGIVIRRVNLNEADQIITLLTPELGKLDCFAKGARRLKNKFCGRMELFYEIDVTGFKGKTLHYLDEVNVITYHPFLASDFQDHGTLFYMAEISTKLIHDEQCVEGAYPLLVDSLRSLSCHAHPEVVLHTYLIKLLTLSGFMPAWNRCLESEQKLDLECPLYFRCTEGGVANQPCMEDNIALTPSIVKWVNFIQLSPLSDILKVTTSPHERQQVKKLLDVILGNILNYPLKSEVFLERI
ncbi:DNA repair protein RecO [Candidatus Peregrinibacteria bacterium CG_4_10_14_0_2_um_filter_43_11]|nr:MAG: DNA repair protein RecO [Candidatus Peregrinibacteria bacterium CG_4_10_14_0_2_um_filter_43_11]